MMNQMYQQQQQPGMGGYGYTQRNQIPMTQTLTADEIRALRNKGADFNLTFTKEDMMRAVCVHRDQNGFTLNENRDGTCTCSVCGETFRMVNMDEAAVQEAVELVKDIMQAVKTYYIDIPVETAREYFRIIPLLDRLPKFYKIALDRFNRYDNGNGIQQNQNMYGFNMFGALTNPMMMQPQMMGQQMMGQPMMGQQGIAPGMNPFAQQQPVFGGYPQQQGMYQQQDMMMNQQVQPQYQQQQPMQQAAPQAQAAPAVQQNKAFKG